MMPAGDDIAGLKALLDRLRAADQTCRIFGSGTHRHRLGPVASESELKRFEVKYEITLPEDYRRFLAEAGNGGAGPGYGMYPLRQVEQSIAEPFVAAPFPYLLSDPLPEEGFFTWDGHGEPPGVIEICHRGCEFSLCLVVAGPGRGNVWDSRNFQDFIPQAPTFTAWYREWLETSLARVENLPLIPLLQVGMSRQEIQDRFPDDWTFKEYPDSGGRYLYGHRIRVTLKLDEQDRVGEVVTFDTL